MGFGFLFGFLGGLYKITYSEITISVFKKLQILYVCLNFLHMSGSREFSFKGPNSENRYFINLNEQGPRLGIIPTWLLYFNTLFKSQYLSTKPKQPNILLENSLFY